jgi:hypothetical protein
MQDKAENTRVPRPEHYEQKGAVTDAIIQTAQDLKEVAIGYGIWKLTEGRPKDPPKE